MNTPTPIINAIGTAVPPYRHEPTARTVAWHQLGIDAGTTNLFSATGQWIAPVPTPEAAALATAATGAHQAHLQSRKISEEETRQRTANERRRCGLTQKQRDEEDAGTAAADLASKASATEAVQTAAATAQ
jgi:hypothetical protein